MSDANAEIESLHIRYDKNGHQPFCESEVWHAETTDSNTDNKRHDLIEWTEDNSGGFLCNTEGCHVRIEGDPSFPDRAKITGSCCMIDTVEARQLPEAA